MSVGEAEEVELPLESVGVRLMRTRESAGMTRAQMAALTRIPERHLAAIEAGDFTALPARPYAVGFSRTYAKALGLDDAAIAAEVRSELAALEPEMPRRTIQTFEPGDPKRVPSSRITWLAALGVVVLVIAGLLLWRSLYAPAGTLGSILPQETPAPAPSTGASPAAPVPSGPVVFTALEPDIWVKFYDTAGTQLLQKQLAQGEAWTIPEGQEVLIWTGRPEALAITIGGQPVPKLSETQKTIKDMPVTAAALLARGALPASPVPSGAPGDTATQPRAAEPRRTIQQRPATTDSAANSASTEAAAPPLPTSEAVPVPAAT